MLFKNHIIIIESASILEVWPGHLSLTVNQVCVFWKYDVSDVLEWDEDVYLKSYKVSTVVF